MHLSLSNIIKHFDHNSVPALVLNDVSLTIGEGELVVIIGPSGCGKTTLLKIAAGVLQPDHGTVQLEPSAKKVVLPIVWQDHRLFPWRTVEENVGYGLELQGISPGSRNTIVRQFLEIVGMKSFARLYPYQLSGGMSQRTALARALAIRSPIVLMDEPFSSVDYQIRIRILNDVQEIQRQLGIAMLYVTHDIEEAVRIATRIIVLSPCPTKILREWTDVRHSSAEKIVQSIQNLLLHE